MKISSYQVENYIKKIADEKISGCLLYGPEPTITRFRFEVIAKKIVNDLADPFLVSQLSSEKIKEDKAILADEFYSIAMLGGRRLIMIKDCDVNTVQALKILLSDPQYGRKSDNFILIQGGDMDKSSALRKLVEESQFLMAIPCYEEDATSLRKSISELFIENNIIVEGEIINLMAKNLGKDRNLIVNEINKIKNYLGDEKKLSLEVFKKITSSNQDENLQDFAVQFASKNYEWCFLRAEKALEVGNESILLVRNLINYFSKLYNAKVSIENSGKSLDDAVKSAQIFYKIEADFRRNLQSLSLKFIAKSLQSFEKLEINLKKGNMSSRLVFLSYIRGYLIKKMVN
jgi:DNA polymerase III subunit delta